MRLTKKDIQNKYNYIIRAGYCELQNICRSYGAKEIGHASGVYGWNWTAYEIEASNGYKICICTGYRDLTGARIKGLEKYEKKAEEAGNDWRTREKKERANIKALANYIIKKLNELKAML